MKSPIKFNNSKIPRYLLKFLPNEFDPRKLLNSDNLSSHEFSNCIKSIYFGGKFSKTTMPNRHNISDKIILNLLSSGSKVILDVGASDGSTSLDLLTKLSGRFKKYYITDINFYLHVIKDNKNSYFFDPNTKECIMLVNNKFIVYNDNTESTLIHILASYFIKKSPAYDNKKIEIIKLCQPALQRLINNVKKIELMEWSVFEEWKEEKVDLIKVANVLKPNIFTNEEIILALRNFMSILNIDGYIIIIKNEEIEKYSLYKYNGTSFELVGEENGGADISNCFNLIKKK